MVSSNNKEAGTVIKIQSNQLHLSAALLYRLKWGKGEESANTGFTSLLQTLYIMFLQPKWRRERQLRETGVNWWLWLLWQSQILLRSTQWKDKKPQTKAAPRENLIRFLKKKKLNWRWWNIRLGYSKELRNIFWDTSNYTGQLEQPELTLRLVLLRAADQTRWHCIFHNFVIAKAMQSWIAW